MCLSEYLKKKKISIVTNISVVLHNLLQLKMCFLTTENVFFYLIYINNIYIYIYIEISY